MSQVLATVTAASSRPTRPQGAQVFGPWVSQGPSREGSNDAAHVWRTTRYGTQSRFGRAAIRTCSRLSGRLRRIMPLRPLPRERVDQGLHKVSYPFEAGDTNLDLTALPVRERAPELVAVEAADD